MGVDIHLDLRAVLQQVRPRSRLETDRGAPRDRACPRPHQELQAAQAERRVLRLGFTAVAQVLGGLHPGEAEAAYTEAVQVGPREEAVVPVHSM